MGFVMYQQEPDSSGAFGSCVMVPHIPGHVDDKLPDAGRARSQNLDEGAQVREGGPDVGGFAETNSVGVSAHCRVYRSEEATGGWEDDGRVPELPH